MAINYGDITADSEELVAMLVKRRKGRLVHWAPSSEIFFVRPDEAAYIDPAMKMESISLGDEVRFATSPDVININGDVTNNNGYHPDYLHTESPRQRTLRVQVAMNKHGYLELNLGNLDLRGIPSEAFNFTRIEVLNVSKNKLSAIPGAIAHLRRMKIFDAHHNHIQVLPDTIANCGHLQEMDLSNNRLLTLPQQFGALRELRILKLGHNRFESIPHAVGELASLRQLDLPGNKLWHLPMSIGNLSNLHLLNLGHNMFEQLPIAICQLRHLAALDLRSNNLLSLPPDCENWRELKELNISSNRFEIVPSCISNLRNLQSLDMSHNKLKVLPRQLTQLARLHFLMVCDNQITLVPNNLEALEYLNLAENRLRNFSVSKMRKLRHLNVNRNVLENLPLGVCSLGQLEVLKMNTNRISIVSQDIVLLKNLKTLDLGHNKLTSLPHLINELENLQSFNVQGNPLDMPYMHTQQRNPPYLQQQTMYPAQVGRQEHYLIHPDITQKPHPIYDKKKRKSKPNTPKKNKNQYPPHHREVSTQYSNPKAKMRERPPLDYVPSSQPPSYPHSKKSLHSEWNEKGAPADGVSTLHQASVAADLTEVSHPAAAAAAGSPIHTHKHTPTRSHTEKSVRSTQAKSTRSNTRANTNVSTYTRRWLDNRRNPTSQGDRSNAATVNDSVGDELSLGDEDYDFQPTTVKDQRLLDVCKEVEDMLNKQMLQPWVQPKSIFKKSLNERGTMRMLNGLRSEHQKMKTYEVNPETGTKTPLETLHVEEEVFIGQTLEVGRDVTSVNGNFILRTKADQFDITPAGGLYKSSVDPNVSIYFPVKAVEAPITITMQLEKIDQEAMLEVKRSDRIVNNILAMGHVVHITQSHNVDFNEQVTLKIPAPPAPKRGRLHILTYNDDNTCSPCSSPYKVYQGYISIQLWHFSGKGAVLTRSKCKYKACKSVEQLLSKLYV